MKPTYVIFVPGMLPPSVFHNTIESAREEAKRLVEACGSTKAMICEFKEGIERVVSTRKLKGNPLADRDSKHPF
jgi:hypothetical protein